MTTFVGHIENKTVTINKTKLFEWLCDRYRRRIVIKRVPTLWWRIHWNNPPSSSRWTLPAERYFLSKWSVTSTRRKDHHRRTSTRWRWWPPTTANPRCRPSVSSTFTWSTATATHRASANPTSSLQCPIVSFLVIKSSNCKCYPQSVITTGR